MQAVTIKKDNLISFFFWLLVSITYKTSSQTIYTQYLSLKKEKLTSLQIEKVDSILFFCEKEKLPNDYAKIAYDFSLNFYKKRDLKTAIKYAQLSINKFQSSNNSGDDYVLALYRIARFYQINQDYSNAILFYKKLIVLNKNKYKIGQSYCEIGRCYSKKNDLFKAVLFFKKGISILEEDKHLNQKYINTLLSQYNNFSIVYNKLNDYKNEALIIKKIEEILQNFNLSKRKKLSITNTLGNFYASKNTYNFKKAKNFYTQNLELSTSLKNINVYNTTLINLSYLYNNERKDSAKVFIEKGLKNTYYKINKAKLHDNYSDYFFIKNDYRNALKHIDKALKVNLGFLLKDDPSFKKLKLSQNKGYTLYCLNRKAEILINLYKTEKDISFLIKAEKTIKYNDKLINIIQADLIEEKTKLYWRNEASKSYVTGAYISFLLKKNHSFFYYSEKNKAILLTESILKNTENFNLPKNIIEREKHLKQLILKLENHPLKNIDKFQDSLFRAKAIYDQYYDSIKSKYPKFFKNKLQSKLITLANVQNNLDKNSIAISYVWNEKEALLGILITNEKTKLFEIKNLNGLKENLKKYKQLISIPFETNNQKQKFELTASKLFNQLLPIEGISSLLSNKHLVIVPDGELQNIPFESLITNEKTNNYLIFESVINYLYSFSFSKYNDSIIRKNKSDFIGYAPKVFFDNKLVKLDYINEEVNSIQNLLPEGKVYKDSIFKEEFFKQSNEAKIIHLATHANADKNPWIAFSDDKLNLYELYTYKNNADLVVLSACNTSIGKIVKGEGAFSLARGFFYSGAKSVISSLWNVNDKATSFIMSHFYKNIKSGQKKSEALANAKKEYLNTHSLASASPYYWASFVLIGNSDSIELSNSNYLLYSFLILFIISLVILIKTQKK